MTRICTTCTYSTTSSSGYSVRGTKIAKVLGQIFLMISIFVLLSVLLWTVWSCLFKASWRSGRGSPSPWTRNTQRVKTKWLKRRKRGKNKALLLNFRCQTREGADSQKVRPGRPAEEEVSQGVARTQGRRAGRKHGPVVETAARRWLSWSLTLAFLCFKYSIVNYRKFPWTVHATGGVEGGGQEGMQEGADGGEGQVLRRGSMSQVRIALSNLFTRA